MTKIFYVSVFAIAAAIGATAAPASFTVSNECVEINVYVSEYRAAVDAGLNEWVAAQCAVAS